MNNRVKVKIEVKPVGLSQRKGRHCERSEAICYKGLMRLTTIEAIDQGIAELITSNSPLITQKRLTMALRHSGT